MERVIEILRNKRINKFEIEQMGGYIGNDEAKIAQLVQLARSEEMPLAWHAWWLCEHIAKQSPTAFAPHQADVISELVGTKHEGKMRLTLNVLANTRTDGEISVPLLNFCLDNMLSPSRSVAVQACCMKLAFRLCRQEPSLLPELRILLGEADPSQLTAATRCCIRKIMKETPRRGGTR